MQNEGRAKKSVRGQIAEEQSSLITQTADIDFTGEAKIGATSLYLAGGALKVPDEVKEASSFCPRLLPHSHSLPGASSTEDYHSSILSQQPENQLLSSQPSSDHDHVHTPPCLAYTKDMHSSDEFWRSTGRWT